MGAKTGIEWCDSTWNPIRGCSRVSEGCRNCYAEEMAARFSGPGQAYEGLAVMQNHKPHWTGKIAFVEKHLLDPLKWAPVVEHIGDCSGSRSRGRRACKCPTRPRRIFVNSMSDLFHEGVTDETRDKIFAVMALCPQHIFQVLTKRPARMLEYLAKPRALPGLPNEPECDSRKGIGLAMVGLVTEDATAIKYALAQSGDGPSIRTEPGCEGELSVWPLPNVWLGVSVENQYAAYERIHPLLNTPAAVRFLSCEPLLDGLSLRWIRGSVPFGITHPRHRYPEADARRGVITDEYDGLRELDWVIAGGESGQGARGMQASWVRDCATIASRPGCLSSSSSGVSGFQRRMRRSRLRAAFRWKPV